RRQLRSAALVMRRIGALLLLLLLPAAGSAHEMRPIFVQLQEDTAGDFLVQWKTPLALPAPPQIVMPAGCSARGEALQLRQSDAWMTRQHYRCAGGVSGGRLQIDYGEGASPAATVLVQVDLASGA